MNLALGVLCIWIGGALVFVAVHGTGSAAPGFYAIWQEVLSGLSGDTPAQGG